MSNSITRDGSTMPRTVYQRKSPWKGAPKGLACRHHATIERSSCRPMAVAHTLLSHLVQSLLILSMTFSFLMNLELRLHLAAEDVDAALEMDSARALQRIPAAFQEILHLRVPFCTPALVSSGLPVPAQRCTKLDDQDIDMHCRLTPQA